MFKPGKGEKGAADAQITVDTRVRVYPDSDDECRGVVVEDFGEMQSQPVDLGGQHFADPARRWAVVLDTGGLVFVDTQQLLPE